ncbi:MAG: hypothetical protein NXH81_06870 [Halieaceae bacterium]|uniref:hypothetical protein n=1 Tax=Haliea alexandrii TaxID=2448162 RepID=UPI001304CABE|nr:hypothetical protein [Haliea alexandrii]MCR9185099.1 hypothetical protein [Halieaceae bacterium]
MSDLEPAIKVFAFIHVVGCLSSLLFPSFFQGLLPSTTYELDVSRLMGFSLNANRAAAASSVLLLYFVFYKRSLLTASLFFFLLLFSESRSVTFLVAIVFAFLILSARISVPKKIAVASFGIIVVLGFLSQFIAFEETVFKIENTLSGDLRYIRAAMLFGGWSLATEFFPFGVGGGMFGSSMSQGSAAYVIIGISHWSTVVDMTGVFDSGFGAILGEYGFLGLLIYVFLVYLTIKYALRARRPTLQVLFLVFLILYMSFFRTVASDFFFSLYFLFLFLLISDFCDRAKVNNHAYPPRP